MAITISSAFDAGNIRVVKQDGDLIDLEIVKDHMSDFYQWFYFRLAGAAGREVTLRITNCAGSAYPHGWPDYRACLSVDREEWVRVAGHQLCRRRPDDPPDARPATASGSPISRLIRWSGTTIWSPRSPALDGRRLRLARQVARRPGHRLPDDRRGRRSRSGSTPASIRARPWPNGGWKARSRNCATPTIRSRGCCAANAPSASFPT